MSQQLYDEIHAAIDGIESDDITASARNSRLSRMLATLADVLTAAGHRAEHALIESWDDLTFAPDAFNPAGSPSPATIDNDPDGFPGTWLFSPTTVNLMGGCRQVPHSWKAGSTMRPHLHWGKTNTGSGEVIWQWKYRISNVGGDFPSWSSWITASNSVSHNNSPTRHALSEFPDLPMPDKRESCQIAIQIQRLPTDAGDTYASDARLFEFDIHLLKDKDGTEEEYPQIG